MSSTRRGDKTRRKNDHYATPAWCIDVAVDLACGPARFSRTVGGDSTLTIRRHVHGLPFIVDAGCGEGAIVVSDFLSWKPDDYFDRFHFPSAQWSMAVMNPPFSHAQQFVEHALESCGSVLALLRLSFLESRKRRAFWQNNPADVYVLSRRPSFMGGKTDSCAYAWFLWGPGERGSLTVV